MFRRGPANLAMAKDEIRAYYGDWLDRHGRHRFSPDSRWGRDVARVARRAWRHVESRLDRGVTWPALVLDVDDTTLTTYEYLANTEFGARQNREALPAIVPVLRLARLASARGVTLFVITERVTERYGDTLSNLVAVGYPKPEEMFLRTWEAPFPPYLPSPRCNTVSYKSATRAHIESQGYTILATVGDQHSDLAGGYAERGFKLPNPMYHVP